MDYLREDFQKAWQGQDPHLLLDKMEGEEFRNVESRRTYRFEFQGKGFFAKIHRGVGWKEIIINLMHYRIPVLGARNEWIALNALQRFGIDTMTPVAFGEKGCNPAKQQSFLVTEELEKTLSLEDLCERWKQSPPSFKLKKAILEKLAEISRIIHNNGLCHRDYYFCHFLIAGGNIDQFHKTGKGLRFYLIDLHRAQIHITLPNRWRLKDLSGLYYSAMDYGFTRNDLFRFIRYYTDLPLKDGLTQHWALWKKINQKAKKLYERMKRKAGHPNY
ncbi:MAG: lipopolysaccharide core heptose(I) kinase RfaP [Candidatus Endonucleobacter bathymodioli]|uniref:Lipopolysaccharide core heptose(I) kinase n=1 Tax=Candidatus Endonucleibacter bathymodioli TaxID=539814 RepID=A0AA90NMX6_9GAMM|nr:lipopolysaccharide core heptose(I) kinase RfaP [Candidatus Endonucleobacter bathymodioli]